MPATPDAPTVPSVYNTAFTHQPNGVTSIATNDILNEFQDSSEEDDSLGSDHASLFGSRHQTPHNAPVPPLRDNAEPPLRLALPPTPPDQKGARQGVDASKATDAPAVKKPRTLPASAVPHTSSLSEVGWREGNSRQDFADDLRLPVQRSRVPLDFSVSRATPSVTDNGFEYTGGSTPAARHEMGRSTIYFGADYNLKWAKPDYSMAGSSERAAETIERLKKAQPLGKSGKKSKAFSPLACIGEEVEQESSVGDGSVIDGQGDLEMNGGSDEDYGDDSADNEEESDILEED